MNDGGSAFPVDGDKKTSWGMTLRDYFAAKAMQSLIIATQENNSFLMGDLVRESFQYADAMIAERDKKV